jgi:cation:H+ antiporter
MNAWLALGVGMIALYFGANALVKGGAGLALRLGLTPLVIGLTVIAFGTSSPEMVVSVQAAQSGNGAIAIGNVVGSNICNIALILGLSALIAPLRAEMQVVRRCWSSRTVTWHDGRAECCWPAWWFTLG